MTIPGVQGSGPWALIDREAIMHNLDWIRRRVGTAPAAAGATPPRLWAVVKADAYGHGLAHAVPALRAADGLAVATLDDVPRLRARGWEGPVLLLSGAGIDPAALRNPALGTLHLGVDDADTLQRLERLPGGLPRVHAWLRHAGELRIGGFDTAGYVAAFARLHALASAGRLAAAGHLHHYAAAEDPQALAAERLAFQAATTGMPGPHCTGNSAALCGEAAVPLHADAPWLRCGLLLYGASALPGRSGAQLGLRPAMTLHARLLSIQGVAAGQSIGYGGGYRCARDTCIGVVGIGYGHGLPRHLSRGGVLLAGSHGRRVPVVGRVAMDGLTVDLGPRPPERPGDLMTLWGHAPSGAALPVETVAASCDTIAAELLSGLTARVPLVARKPAD